MGSARPVSPHPIARLRRRAASIVVALALGAHPGFAVAAGGGAWPLADPAPVLLAYGAPFGAESRTHRGVDLEAEEGDGVLAPFGGTVTFAGRVPGEGGGTVAAVTVETTGGLRVTCLPLARLTCTEGDAVSAGDTLGEIAPTGDASCPSAHLHVSVRRGETYLDPAAFLRPPAPAGATPEDGVPEGAPAGDEQAAVSAGERARPERTLPPRTVSPQRSGARTPAPSAPSGARAEDPGRTAARTAAPAGARPASRAEVRPPSPSPLPGPPATVQRLSTAQARSVEGAGGQPALSPVLPGRSLDVLVVLTMVLAAAAIPLSRADSPVRAVLARALARSRR